MSVGVNAVDGADAVDTYECEAKGYIQAWAVTMYNHMCDPARADDSMRDDAKAQYNSMFDAYRAMRRSVFNNLVVSVRVRLSPTRRLLYTRLLDSAWCRPRVSDRQWRTGACACHAPM